MDFKIDDQSCFNLNVRVSLKKERFLKGKKPKKNLGGTKTPRFAIDAFTVSFLPQNLKKNGALGNGVSSSDKQSSNHRVK